MQIKLFGAAGEVTGSGYLVETKEARVLIDFGLFQGGKGTETRNRNLGKIKPNRLDAIVLTHAHLDHAGRIPLLIQGGFHGKVYSTLATGELGYLLLSDSAHLQEADCQRENRKRQRQGKPLISPLYTQDEVERFRQLFVPLVYHEAREIAEGIKVRLVNSGHILGSASAELTVTEGGATRTIVFSGDLGQKNMPILRDPTPFTQADLVFLESTYGNREHRPLAETVVEFKDALEASLTAGEKVLIPSFAVDRSQMVLYYIAELVRNSELPEFPIYLDSPMAIQASRIYADHQDLFNPGITKLIQTGRFAEDLRNLHLLETAEESRSINDIQGAGVIIAGSGMCNGGRIMHHLKHNLWRKKVAVLIVGYQAAGTLGRQLVDGVKKVIIHGEEIAVKAGIHTLGGFSGHAGQSGLVEWFGAVAPAKPRLVLMHGEPNQRNALRDAITAKFGITAECPLINEIVSL